MKCDLCNKKVEELFLGKIKGTYFTKGKKRKVVCQSCQKKEGMDALKKKVQF